MVEGVLLPPPLPSSVSVSSSEWRSGSMDSAMELSSAVRLKNRKRMALVEGGQEALPIAITLTPNPNDIIHFR